MCRALAQLTSVRVSYLLQYLNDIAKYMLTMTASKNEEVSMEACEFWSALAETKYCEQVARDLLPT